MKTSYSPEQLKDPLVSHSETIMRKCVQCGLCTATCSSYVILGDERASPRGRINLINRMMKNNENPSKASIGFLDNCLTCLSCMTTCPSGVDYVHLIDMARARINKKARRKLSTRVTRSLLAGLLPYPARMKMAMKLGRLARPLTEGFQKLGMTSIAGMLDALPQKSARSPRYEKRTPANDKRQKLVAMLPGCSNDLLRPSINEATVALLSRMGIEVIVPSGLGCCGTIEHHLGEEEKAIRSAKRNVDVLSKLHDEQPLDAIVITASGCGSMLKDYAHLLRNDEGYAKRAADIAELTHDVSEVLTAITMLAPTQWSDIKVAYHGSCSLEHGQQITKEPRSLLSKAGYTVLEVPEGHICCGSAGTYSIMQPVISKALLTRKLDNIDKIEPDIIAAGNIGCINHMATKSNTPIVHTIELLNWAYGGECPAELKHLEERIQKISGVMVVSRMDEYK
ncbi:MAG: glycolate oxidase subunit GlcF [bacterium]|nr:glycolate oxidase subunit GlcF [bacterium]